MRKESIHLKQSVTCAITHLDQLSVRVHNLQIKGFLSFHFEHYTKHRNLMMKTILICDFGITGDCFILKNSVIHAKLKRWECM